MKILLTAFLTIGFFNGGLVLAASGEVCRCDEFSHVHMCGCVKDSYTNVTPYNSGGWRHGDALSIDQRNYCKDNGGEWLGEYCQFPIYCCPSDYSYLRADQCCQSGIYSADTCMIPDSKVSASHCSHAK